jgi:hypothetical protein
VRAHWSALAVTVLSTIASASASPAAGVAPVLVRSLGELDVPLYGISAGVEPASPVVPKQTAAGVRIVVTAGGRTLSSHELSRLLGGPFEVKAELTGPGLTGVLSLPRTGAEAIPSPDPLVLTFPGLPRAGDYDISNIRLVRAGRPVLDVSPRRVTLRVIDEILVTSVTTRPLTLDEIRERGVVLDASAYLGFEFAIALKLDSTPVHFQFPVVFDREGVPIPIPLQPPPEPLRSVVAPPQLVPVLLRPVAPERDPDGAPPDSGLPELPNTGVVRIPSLLVIPGSVGYLKQFFSVQLIVGNGAPVGSGLVLRDVTGTLKLPPGADGQAGTPDDPLALPLLERGPQSPIVEVATDGGGRELLPGEFGRADLTLRGEREGRHDVDFEIRAQLDGLAVGPRPLEGSAHGVVLVRNAYFDVTFTVPTVVRADEEFSVFATVTNVGQGTGNDLKMTLDGARLSGARLVSGATRTIDELLPGDAATLEYRFTSLVTGEVVASYLRFDTSGGVNVTGRLSFMLGVGERRVAMSPDTLILPTSVDALPSSLVRAAMRVLGQAWSAATATILPPGVLRPSTLAVFKKGLSVAEAGLRVELGQPLPDALRDLLLDLHGDLDPGFDQVLRETRAGRDLDRLLGVALADAAGGDPLGYEGDAARIAASGPPFLSVAIDDQGSGSLPAEISLTDGAGLRTDLADRGLPSAVVVALGSGASAPRLGWVSSLSAPPYAIHVNGTAEGTVGLSLTFPDRDGRSRHARISPILVRAGSRHRLVISPTRDGQVELETDLTGDGVYEGRERVDTMPLVSQGPRLVAAATIGPETIDGASPFGTYAALLFDRVVSEADAADPSNYEIADNSVLAARRQLSGRLVFVAFEQPEGPLVPTRLAIRGVHDERGRGGSRQEQPLASRLQLPGAVVRGRVLQADGTPVTGALVTYMNTRPAHAEGRWDCTVNSESGISAQRSDAAGRFVLRYVVQNPCGGPFRLETRDPATGALRGVKTYVRVNGQRLSLDLVLIGHGKVTGQVRHADKTPAAGARVRVVSVTDSQIGIVTTTDAQGLFAVEGMTVGAVTATAVLGTSLGRAAGRLDAAGGTTTVDVTLDGRVDLTGVVRKLDGGVLTAVPGVDVVYYLGNTPLGISVTDSLGQYRLLGVPAGPYTLAAGLNQRDKTSLDGNSVAGQKVVQNLVIEIRDYSSYGTVKGTVKRIDGSVVPDAWVSDNVVQTQADSLGRYELGGVALSANPRTFQAVSPDGRRSGSTSAMLTVPGQVVNGADIQLSGLGAVAFQVLDADGAPVAQASVGLQGNCLHPCGCEFTNTDAQGIARFADLPFGPVSARAVVSGAPGGGDTALGSANVTSEQVAAGGVIRLTGFGTVTGVVANPDGQGAHGASVELVGLRFVNGGGFCGLESAVLARLNTNEQGEFRLDSVHVGPVSARASSVVFPQVVAKGGRVGVAGEKEHLEIRLVDTMAGVLSGTVWEPNGVAGAGADVEVTASGPGPDVTVRTDSEGRYSFARVLPAGGYLLTARDARPDGTGSLTQSRIWLQPSQPAHHDLRLEAKGLVRVRVVDGAGQPVENATVRVELSESHFPYRRYLGTIEGAGDQPLVFPTVFEGDFSVTASDNFARGGRSSGEVPPDGQPVEIQVQLSSVGRVVGRFLWADRETPLPLGVVTLVAGGRAIGQQTTASEGEVGSYAFDYVPAGPVRLEAQDPRSGRTGIATSSLTGEGQVLSLDVVAHGVGRVEGEVTLNGQPAPSANVSLSSGSYRVMVTADSDGHYAVDGVPEGQVYARADLGGGFLAGRAQGSLSGEGETLSLPVSLHGAGAIEGRLLAAGTRSPGSVSLVTLASSGRSQTTTTDSEGRFRFDLVPEGNATILADALASIDCARESVGVAAGETTAIDLELLGVGAVEGSALSSAGPVGGRLTVSGIGPGCTARLWTLNVGPSGGFRIPEMLSGQVTASFATKSSNGPSLYASDAGVVRPSETTRLSLLVEPSGAVRGTVVHEDGNPAFGSQVRVEASGGRSTVVHTGETGVFLAEGLPAGPITLRVSDAVRGGVALVTGLVVTADRTLDAGSIDLLETPLAVLSATPADGAIQVSVTQPVEIQFNAPMVSASGISLRAGGKALAFATALSADRRTVTLTSGSGWPDSAEVALDTGLWVTDVYGRRPATRYQSRFRTVDLSPPRVIWVAPANKAIEVDPATTILVRFDEPLSTGADLQSIVRLSSADGDVAGVVASTAPDSLLFTPASSLEPNRTYAMTVNGAIDLLGHVQVTAFSSSFTTPDDEAPVLRLESPADGGWTKDRRPTIRVVVQDALSGPDASRAVLKLDGEPVSATRGIDQFSHVPPVDLADGLHTVEASAHDRAGNPGDVVSSFYLDSQAPSAATLTSPSTDQVLSGVVTLSGSASDTGSGVARLNFLRDGQWVAEALATNNLSTTWNTAGSAEGPVRIAAHAVDVAGNTGPSGAPVRAIVNNKPLKVSITSPDEGFPVRTEVTVAASPSEPVARVEFRAGDGPVLVDESAPYEAVLDVSSRPEGDLVVTVTAVGVAPETSDATRRIVVDRTPPAPPDPTRVHAEAIAGSALVLGVPGAVEPGSRVEVVNPSTGAANQRPSFHDGSFAMRVAAGVGETLAVTATDPVGNQSDPLALNVDMAPAEDASVPVEGLQLWARSGEGVTLDTAGRVASWADQSGTGNHLRQPAVAGRPEVVRDPASGRDMLRFDGLNDSMSFTTRLDGTIRSVFAVVKQTLPNATWRVFLGDTTKDDFSPGWKALWGLASPFVLDGQTWLNGVAADGTVAARPQSLSVLSVLPTGGVSADRLFDGKANTPWVGDVAELVVSSDVLSGVQRKLVEDYLARRYALYVPTVIAPLVSPDGGTFEGSMTVTLAAPTPGSVVRYTLDGSGPTEASPLYVEPLSLARSAILKARAFRPGHIASTVSTAGFVSARDFSPASVDGLGLWVRGDAGVAADAAGRVSAWRDQSGRGNDLAQSTLASQPVFTRDQVNGLPVLRFDGSNDSMRFTTRFDGTVRAVFAVLRQNLPGATWRVFLGDSTKDDFSPGLTSLWGSASPLVTDGQTWLNGVAVDGKATNRPESMSVLSVLTAGGVSADRLFAGRNTPWVGDIAELIVYTEPLTNGQRKSIEDYLALKYAAYLGTAGAPEFTPNGTTFETSVEVSLHSPTPGAEIRYTTDGSDPATDSTLYESPLTLTSTTMVRARAFRSGMDPSPVAVAAFTKRSDFTPAGVPGLALWTRADAAVTSDAVGRVSEWRDQSGLGNHLVQATSVSQPVLLPGQVNGLPVLRFDGSNDSMIFTNRLDGTIRAVFAVLRQTLPGATWRVFLGDSTKDDFSPGLKSLWGSASPFVTDGQTWLNGVAVDGKATSRPESMAVLSVLTTGGVSAGQLFAGRNTPWVGDIAELILYTEPLTNGQRKAIEDYLALKYAPYVGTAGVPEFTPNGVKFETSVEVSLRSPTPGAEIRYTTDGSDPTTDSRLYESPLVLFETTTVRARAFRAGMTPSPTGLATFTRAATFSPESIAGLGLWVMADAGVAADAAGRVSEWRDQSALGNHLVQATGVSQPVLLPGQVNGLPVLRFDGSNDSMRFTTRFDGTIRAAFAVLRQTLPGATWRVFLGDSTKDDFSPGWKALWGAASPLVTDGQTRVNGVAVDGKATNRPESMSVLSVLTTGGVSADRLFDGRNTPWVGDIAELVVYTEPLTNGQRKSVEDYLALKYAAYVATAAAPEITPGGATFEAPVEVSLHSSTPGAEIHYTTDGAEPTESSDLYTGPFVLTASAIVQARSFRASMTPSPVSVAHFTRASELSPASVPGLALWARADVGVASDAAGRVSAWRDLSARGADLAQANGAAQPSLVPDVQGDLPAMRFDGVDDALLFKIRLTSIRTVFWVVREEASASNGYRFLLGDATTTAFLSGAVRQIWSASTSQAVLRGETRLNGVVVDGTTTSRPTSLSVVSLVTTDNVSADAFSRDRVYGRSWWGDLAELVVYDRPLSAVERKSVEDYLALKYALYVPTLAAPVISPDGSTSLVPVRATLSAPAGTIVRYTVDGSDPTESSAVYTEPLVLVTRTTVKARAFRPGFNPSPVSSASFLDGDTPAPLRTAGLRLWVRADAGIVYGAGGSVSAWADQSGSGNHLVQPTAASQPRLVDGQPNGLPVVRFDGQGDAMLFTRRLTTIRTVFWVIRADPSSNTAYRLLLGDSSVYDLCSGTPSAIWSAAYASPSVRSGETRLNGTLVNGSTTARPTSLSVISLVTTGDVSADAFSRDRIYGRSWWGDLAELVVYDRPLSDTERESIEAYLAEKHGLWVPRVVAPVISPSGGRVAGAVLVQIDTATPGATIRYTLDDTEPTEASAAYTGPLEITTTTRVRAKAFLAGRDPSHETVATFLGEDE